MLENGERSRICIDAEVEVDIVTYEILGSQIAYLCGSFLKIGVWGGAFNYPEVKIGSGLHFKL